MDSLQLAHMARRRSMTKAPATTFTPMNRTNRNRASGRMLITKASMMQQASMAGQGMAAMVRAPRRQARTMSRATSSM
jgi:hypothetical protein